ncbi:MAG: DUF2064 domain-containing protein [Saprospiraceae bacterium]
MVEQKAKNLKIAARLIANTKRVVAQTDFPLFIANGHQQKGANFGERLANEVEKVFSHDFSRVIIIGNDCPELCSQDLRNADEFCDQANLVLGPTQAGGTYLITLNRAQFDKELFRQLNWETAELLAAFKTYAAQQNASIHWLATLQDINDPAALQQLLKSLQDSHKFKKWILLLTVEVRKIILNFIVTRIPAIVLQQPSLRAP